MTTLKAFFTTLKTQIADIWNKSKVFLLAIGSLIVYFEWQQIKEYFLTYMGQKEITSDKKEDQQLAAKEKADNDQANALVQQASNENVDANWNKKK